MKTMKKFKQCVTDPDYDPRKNTYLCQCATCIAHMNSVKIAAQKLADAVDNEIMKRILDENSKKLPK